ncbi:hypothetical protein SDJN03_11065, partial [Cucurbita argyrosperma subsp. sororia]
MMATPSFATSAFASPKQHTSALTEWNVTMKNNLDPGHTMLVHCKSKDDDLAAASSFPVVAYLQSSAFRRLPVDLSLISIRVVLSSLLLCLRDAAFLMVWVACKTLII